MTAALSIQTLSPESHPASQSTNQEEDKKKKDPRENVPAIPTDPGGWQAIPHSLNTLARKKLQGSKNTIFWFLWDKTIRHHKVSDEIPMCQFKSALPDSEKTIQRTLDWLRDNDWIVIEESIGKVSRYSIPQWILDMCYPEQPEDNPGQNDRTNPGQNDRHHKRDQKHKKTSPIPPSYNTISVVPKQPSKIRGEDGEIKYFSWNEEAEILDELLSLTEDLEVHRMLKGIATTFREKNVSKYYSLKFMRVPFDKLGDMMAVIRECKVRFAYGKWPNGRPDFARILVKDLKEWYSDNIEAEGT